MDTLRSDWITTGPKVKQFQEEFSAAIGASDALALSSCTAAMHLALTVLRIGPGDAVITTPMTFCSSVHVIEHVGATPLLADICPDTLDIDPVQVKAILGKHANVKAVLPVHLYGHPCEMDSILQIAKEFRLAVVEDAAHALPARYDGRLIGNNSTDSDVPRFTCFSFYATKNLTTGEGGMLVGPPERMEDCRVWSLHGMDRDAFKRYSQEGSWFYEVIHAGFKYNMMDLQAAIGLHQLKNLRRLQQRRCEIVNQYNETFSKMEELQVPVERPEVEHAWHIYALRLNLERIAITRSRFIEELKARNIGASVHFIPVHIHPYYRQRYGYKPEDFPVSYREYQRLVSLPLFPRMTDQDVQDVITAVSEIIDEHRR